MYKMTGTETFFTLTITPSTLITLSSTGLLKIYDPRSLDTPLSCVSMATTKPGHTSESLCVQVSRVSDYKSIACPIAVVS